MIGRIASSLPRTTPRRPIINLVSARCQSTDNKTPSNNLGLEIASKDQVLTIRFDRPHKFNAITRDMYMTLTKTFQEVNKDKSVKVVLLTGNGEFYSSGNDLSNFAAAMKHPDGFKAGLLESSHILFNFVESLINLEKFIVAAVNGPAVGIPVTTLPLCDYVVASDKATFQTPFTALGQCPEACSSLTFPSILGRSRANELLMLNMTWDAQKAKNYGLVSEVVEHDKFEGFLNKFTSKVVSSCYPNSMLVSKAVVQNPEVRKRLSETNRRECDAIVELWAGEECMDAVQKFFKRSKN
jgi:peroxisomal 3,2-trans-enoyl-CoA isomerase